MKNNTTGNIIWAFCSLIALVVLIILKAFFVNGIPIWLFVVIVVATSVISFIATRKAVKNEEKEEVNEMMDYIKKKDEKKAADAAREAAGPSENEWQCPNCKKIHPKYVGTCGCGTRKP